MLRLATHGLSLAQIAAVVGVKSRDTCREWLRGTKRPTAEARARIAAAFPSVAPSSWDRVPELQRADAEHAPELQRVDAEHAGHAGRTHAGHAGHAHTGRAEHAEHAEHAHTGHAGHAHTALPAVTLELPSTVLEHVNELLAAMRAERLNPSLTQQSDRIRFVTAEMRLLALKQTVVERSELSEDRYVHAHPAWVQLRDTIARVLSAYPDAAAAVVAALEQLEASP